MIAVVLWLQGGEMEHGAEACRRHSWSRWAHPQLYQHTMNTCIAKTGRYETPKTIDSVGGADCKGLVIGLATL